MRRILLTHAAALYDSFILTLVKLAAFTCPRAKVSTYQSESNISLPKSIKLFLETKMGITVHIQSMLCSTALEEYSQRQEYVFITY